MLNEIPDGVVSRVALPAVAEFLAVPKRLVVRAIQMRHLISESFQRPLQQIILSHRQTPE
ncbi:hypothetical protein D3C72_2362640 [compost metagenome]